MGGESSVIQVQVPVCYLDWSKAKGTRLNSEFKNQIKRRPEYHSDICTVLCQRIGRTLRQRRRLSATTKVCVCVDVAMAPSIGGGVQTQRIDGMLLVKKQ